MADTAYLRSLTPVDYERAQGPQKNILDVALKQLGFIPNMYLGMANAPALLSTYLHGYGLFRGESGFTPAEQEVIFLAISAANDCSYCLAAHSMIADKVSGVPKDVLAAIVAGKPIDDPKLAALFALATEMVATLGRPDQKMLDAFLKAGYEERHLLYLILAIAVKTLSNFSNHAFATRIDARFADYKRA